MDTLATTAVSGALATFEWFLNLLKMVIAKTCWYLIKTTAYILKTGFVGYKLGGVLDSTIQAASTSSDPMLEHVKQVFSALIQSIQNAIPGMPDVIKPILHVSLFSLVQYALEKIYLNVPKFFESMFKESSEVHPAITDKIIKIFSHTVNDKNPTDCNVACERDNADCKSISVPCENDVSEAVNHVKSELTMGKFISKVYIQKRLKNWKNRSVKRLRDIEKYTRRELVKICMQHKDKHGYSCGGTKKSLARRIRPYIDVIDKFSPKFRALEQSSAITGMGHMTPARIHLTQASEDVRLQNENALKQKVEELCYKEWKKFLWRSEVSVATLKRIHTD
jgi:hypothetical protein